MSERNDTAEIHEESDFDHMDEKISAGEDDHLVEGEQSYVSSSEDEGGSAEPSANHFSFLKPFIVVGLIVYFIYLIFAKAPASLAAWAVHKSVPGLWLGGVNGSLWNGYASAAQVEIVRKTIPLGRIDWSLSPASILLLKPCLNFQTDAPGQLISGQICQSPFGSTDISNLILDAPISSIESLLPIDALGQISLQIVNGSGSPSNIQALDARFTWQNAIAMVEDLSFNLGAFEGVATQDGNGGVIANISDIEGPFSVKAQASWHPGSKVWKIEATIIPRENAPDPIIQALQIFGEELGGGAYKIVWP